MRRVAAAAGAVMTLAIASTGPVLAWGDGCGGHAVECYDKVRLPDVYATQARPVVVHPGYSEVVETPPVVVNQPEKVLVSPGRWHEEHTSASALDLGFRGGHDWLAFVTTVTLHPA